jgi:hypothetical protein
MLGRKPVLDRHHDRVDLRGDALAPRVHHRDVAHHEAAAVDLEHARPRRARGCLRPVHAHRYVGRLRGTRDSVILLHHVLAVGRCGKHHDPRLTRRADRLHRGHLLHRRQHGEQVAERGIELVGAHVWCSLCRRRRSVSRANAATANGAPAGSRSGPPGQIQLPPVPMGGHSPDDPKTR